MATVLITGANRGLGLEFARQYAAAGWTVLATCRDPDDAADLRALEGRVTVHPLDVVDGTSVAALAKSLGDTSIDLLINNAGVGGGGDFGSIDYERWKAMMDVNVLGPARVTEALVDHVARGDRKLVVVISSWMGSIEQCQGGRIPYRSSKTAVNMVMKCMALALEPRHITVISAHPGWVRTDMGGASAPLSPEDSIADLTRLFERIEASDSGSFFNHDGEKLPW